MNGKMEYFTAHIITETCYYKLNLKDKITSY